MKVVLELQEQLANVRRVTVRHDIVIGRGADCNLRLSAPQMSRRHCFLRVGRDGVSVTDLDSANGTYVDKKRIKPGERVELVTGSILTLGPVNFIVHLKEDSGSASKSEGERSRSRSKPPKPSAESSTIVSSASAIIADGSKARAPVNESTERAGVSSKLQKSSPDTAKTRDEVADVAVDTAKKAASVAAIASVAAPVVDQLTKPQPASPSPVAESAAEKIDNDVESPAAESSWLTDDSPDDMSFFGGQQSEAAEAPLDGKSGSDVVDAIDDVVALDDVEAVEDVVEEVVEVLDDNDIFAEEVADAALVEPVDAIEAVEVLDDESEEVVEILEDETPANAITADLDESDLFGEQFVEVIQAPEVLAEEVVAAEIVEVFEEPAEVVEVLEDNVEVLEATPVEQDSNDDALVEVLEESNDFFDQLGIVEDEPQPDAEQVAVVNTTAPEIDLADEVVDADWFEAPQAVTPEQGQNEAEFVEVLDEPADFFDSLGIETESEPAIEEVAAVDDLEVFADVSVEAEPVAESAAAVKIAEEQAAVELLDESSDFFDSLGIETEPEPAIQEVAAAEAVDDVEVFADVSVKAEPVAESAAAVEVAEEEAAVELLDESSDFFDSLGIEVEPEKAIEEVAAVDDVEVFADVSVETEPVAESAGAAEIPEEEAAVELLDESSDFFDSLGIEVEPEKAIEEVAAVDDVEVFADVSVEAEPVAESAGAAEIPEEEAAVELLDESSDFFDSLGIEVEPEPAIEEVAAVEPSVASNDSSETDWFSDAVEEVVDGIEEQPCVIEATPSRDDIKLSAAAEPAAQEEFDFLDDPEADLIVESATDTPAAALEVLAPTHEEPADVDAEIEVVEEFDFFDDVEAVEPTAAAEHVDAVEEFDAAAEEVELFEEVATADNDVIEDVVAEEVAEATEADDGSNWFSGGDDKGNDDDDSALREFLKGF
jgi:pSer/pThr/pTyr-binding forkhead associated (FHA) protein